MAIDTLTKLQSCDLAYNQKALRTGDTVLLGASGSESEYTVDKVWDDPETGFKAMALKNTTGDVIISFAGTEGLQDIHSDLSLGWNQWEKNRPEITAYVASTYDNSPNTQFHLTGHSLGGGLEQYAAYEIVNNFSGINIDGFSINGFGGESALRQHVPDYDETILNGLPMLNYRIENDLVSRLGTDGHLGEIRCVETPEYLDPVKAHLLGTAILLAQQGLFDTAATQSPIEVNYMDISALQPFAA